MKWRNRFFSFLLSVCRSPKLKEMFRLREKTGYQLERFQSLFKNVTSNTSSESEYQSRALAYRSSAMKLTATGHKR